MKALIEGFSCFLYFCIFFFHFKLQKVKIQLHSPCLEVEFEVMVSFFVVVVVFCWIGMKTLGIVLVLPEEKPSLS